MTEKLYDVFISYSTIDNEIAFELLDVLEKNGLNCGIAPRNIQDDLVPLSAVLRQLKKRGNGFGIQRTKDIVCRLLRRIIKTVFRLSAQRL